MNKEMLINPIEDTISYKNEKELDISDDKLMYIEICSQLFVTRFNTLSSKGNNKIVEDSKKERNYHWSNLYGTRHAVLYYDRNPDTFKYILSYLRGYNEFLPCDLYGLQNLKQDSEYFNISSLVEIIDKQLNDYNDLGIGDFYKTCFNDKNNIETEIDTKEYLDSSELDNDLTTNSDELDNDNDNLEYKNESELSTSPPIQIPNNTNNDDNMNPLCGIDINQKLDFNSILQMLSNDNTGTGNNILKNFQNNSQDPNKMLEDIQKMTETMKKTFGNLQ